MQYLLAKNAQAKGIINSVQDLRDTKQRPVGDEKQFSRRINDAFCRFGNMFSSQGAIKLKIDDFILAINSLVQQYCDTHEGCMYMGVMQGGKAA